MGPREQRRTLVHPTRQPIENCFVESFNDKLRDECLNIHWFLGLDDARDGLENRRHDYNAVHSSLGNRTPAEYAQVLQN